MKIFILIFSTLIIVACNRYSINDDSDNIISSKEIINKYLTYSCYGEINDTLLPHELLFNTSSYPYNGKYIIRTIDTTFFKFRIKFLNKEIIKNKGACYFGRNTQHIAFYLRNNETILFSNDYLNKDTVCLSDISKLIHDYYLADTLHLRFDVSIKDKGVEVFVFEGVGEKLFQDFIARLGEAYNMSVEESCIRMFNKNVETLDPIETIELMDALSFNTEIIMCDLTNLIPI